MKLDKCDAQRDGVTDRQTKWHYYSKFRI